MFRTSDLYVAAGLTVASGIQADKMIIEGGIVFCEYDNPALDVHVRALHAGELKVDVRALRIEHIALKKRVFELVDKKGKDNENAAA